MSEREERNTSGRSSQVTRARGVVDREQPLTMLRDGRAALGASEERFRVLAANITDGVVLLFDQNLRYVLAEGPALVQHRLDSEQFEGFVTGDVLPERVRADLEPYYRAALDGCMQVLEYEYNNRVYHLQILPVPDAVGVMQWGMVIARDVTIQRQTDEYLRYIALYDVLTDLPNRVLFRDRLQQAMAQAQRSGQMVAVLMLDLDRFKSVNDSLGHAAGDRLLQIVALRLRDALRACDTIARLGGDEFIIILEDILNAQDAVMVAQRILSTLLDPIHIDGREVYTSASIGIAFYPADASDADSLMKHADVAMYRAKHQGRNNYAFYTVDLHLRALEWITLESDLRKSLTQGDFFLCYQPQMDLHTGRPVGVEALVRWQHSELGMLTPNRFIPIAEESGLIVPLGMWIICTACAQNRAWQQIGLPPLRVAVNLSARQLVRPELVTEIAQVLQETGLDPGYLELELTESMLMLDAEGIVTRLHELKALGVQIAVDDFGIGYSSLNYLRRLPIDTLKIDRSFVHDIPSNVDGATIAKTIIAMAHNLKMRVIAEGVECVCQQVFLEQQGCDEMQGYLYSHPLPAAEIAPFLRRYGEGVGEQPYDSGCCMGQQAAAE